MKGMCRTTSASLLLWYLLLLAPVGMNSVQAGSRIVGGMNVTNRNEFPFHAIPNSNTTLCGATLVWGNVLKTAAHCGESIWNAGVWIGGTNALFNKTGSQYYSTQLVIIHPNYDPNFVRNDIALIMLNNTVNKVPCVRTYCTAKDNLQICNRGLPEGGKDSCSDDSGGPLFIKKYNNNICISFLWIWLCKETHPCS
jgi:secreted trypsin-like serine protease